MHIMRPSRQKRPYGARTKPQFITHSGSNWTMKTALLILFSLLGVAYTQPKVQGQTENVIQIADFFLAAGG